MPQLLYLNLRIIQYQYGISIDQTYHIKDTILAQWFLDASERVNSDPNRFKEDRIFELTLADTLLATPAEIYHLEERYLGNFSAHIRTFLHIMQ